VRRRGRRWRACNRRESYRPLDFWARGCFGLQSMDGCFRRTPTRTGWIENRNVAIEYRWSGPHRALCRNYGRVRAVEVIVTVSSAVSAVRQATSVIPIVFLRWQIDTVGSGLCLKPPEDRHRFPQSVRACTTAATIGASTGPRIRNRAPVLNSTSITPAMAARSVILGSRPSPALPNRSHYLGLRLRHRIAPNIQSLNLSITRAS